MDKILGAFLILWLPLGWVSGQQEGKGDQQQVKQSPESLVLEEEEISILSCTYENSAFDYFPWYRQYPGKGPELLIAIHSVDSRKEDGRFTVLLSRSTKHFSLHINASQPGDSATYFCAARYSGSGSYGKLTFGQGTILTVHPNVKNPDPAVYQLRSPKSSRTSICLFTDFDSNTDVPQAMDSSAFSSKSTVLDMRSTHSKSYGALLWSNSTDFGCQDTFNETFYPSSEYPCDVTSVEKSFETDINLNFQNLSVIGFRILLLKVAGFNLLMTLRLWSRSPRT